MLQLIISLWLAVVLITSFTNFKACLCLFLSYMLFVPFVQIDIGIHLGENFVYLIILIGFLKNYWKQRVNYDFKIFKPFFFLFGFYLLMIPFQSGLPANEMINSFRVSAMSNFILPFVLWNAYKFTPEIKKVLERTLVISIIVICSYGLYLTKTGGLNPWLMAILPLGGSDFNLDYAFSDDGRVFGRISSVFNHPMTFGLFLDIVLIYVLSIRDKLKWYISILIFSIVILNIVVCGVRSAIGSAAIGVSFYLIKARKIKLAFGALIVGWLLMSFIRTIPGMGDYVNSITDINNKKSDVSGSSIEMRMEQLNGCFHEISNCPFTGKGYGWVAYYMKTKGDHPVILAFESLIYVVLCNNGYLGVLIWIIFVIGLFKMKWPNKELRVFVPTLFITYIGYSCITGEYGYLRFTLIIYVMMLIHYWPKENLIKKIHHANTLV